MHWSRRGAVRRCGTKKKRKEERGLVTKHHGIAEIPFSVSLSIGIPSPFTSSTVWSISRGPQTFWLRPRLINIFYIIAQEKFQQTILKLLILWLLCAKSSWFLFCYSFISLKGNSDHNPLYWFYKPWVGWDPQFEKHWPTCSLLIKSSLFLPPYPL